MKRSLLLLVATWGKEGATENGATRGEIGEADFWASLIGLQNLHAEQSIDPEPPERSQRLNSDALLVQEEKQRDKLG